MTNDELKNRTECSEFCHHIKDQEDLLVGTHLLLEAILSKLNSCSLRCQIFLQQHQHHVQQVNQNVFVDVCVAHTSKAMKDQCIMKTEHKIFLLCSQLFWFLPNKDRLCARVGERPKGCLDSAKYLVEVI